MRNACVLGLIFAAALYSQSPVTPEQLPELRTAFEKHGDEQQLACQVMPWRTNVNFSFRIQGGYSAEVPMRQFVGEGHRVVVLMRIRPQVAEAEPYYFIQIVPLPQVPERTKSILQLNGGLFYGEGKYQVDMALTDLRGHVCRKKWNVDARLSGKERELKVVQEPGSVQSVEIPQWTGKSAVGEGAQARRATVFLNVAPLRMRSQKLSVFDRALMFGTLKAVLEQSPFTSVRLVAFNLDRHNEIFRQEVLTQDGYNRLRYSLHDLSLGTIDIAALADRTGHFDLLSRLITEETSTASPTSDAVIFIGPSIRRSDKLPEGFPTVAANGQRFFYISYSPFQTASFPDLITRVVKTLAGKWYPVHTPQELAAALQKMRRELGAPAMASN